MLEERNVGVISREFLDELLAIDFEDEAAEDEVILFPSLRQISDERPLFIPNGTPDEVLGTMGVLAEEFRYYLI